MFNFEHGTYRKCVEACINPMQKVEYQRWYAGIQVLLLFFAGSCNHVGNVYREDGKHHHA